MIKNSRYRRRIKISLPQQSGSLTYNGKSQSPVWLNYDSGKMTMSGITSSINAGTFTATFTPKPGYCWEDGSRTTKNVVWKIGKLTPILSLGKTEFHTGKGYELTDSTAINCTSDGIAIIRVSTTMNGTIKDMVQNDDSISFVFDNGYNTPANFKIYRQGKTLFVEASSGNIIVNFDCSIYFKSTANCNQSSTAAFKLYRHGFATGS